MRELQVASFDGVPIRVSHSELAAGREYVVVVLPLATKASFIEPAVKHLSGRYNVVTWEARLILEPGVAPRDEGALSVAAHARDAGAVMDYFGVPAAFLIGYCSGAATALHAAALAGRRVTKLALVNGAFFMSRGECDLTQYERDVFGLAPQIAAGYDRASDIFGKFFAGDRAFKRAAHEFAGELNRPYDNADSFYRFGVVINQLIQADLRSVARSLRVPTLVASGKRDERTHYASSVLLSSEIPRGELCLDEVGDHYEFCRAKPGLMEKIDTFFRDENRRA